MDASVTGPRNDHYKRVTVGHSLPHSYGDVTITCEGLQILTYAQHFWPLSNEDSLECHTISSWAITTYFYDLGLSRLGFEHLPLAGPTL